MSNLPIEVFNAISGIFDKELQPPRNEVLRFEISGTPNAPIRCVITDTNYFKLDFDCDDWNGASVIVSSKSKLGSSVFISDPEDTITENATKFLKW